MMLFLSSWIVILSISLTASVRLDGNCIGDPQCEGSDLLCREGTCQCKAPSYSPCQSSCVLNPRSAYEGESCEQQENCVDNTVCSSEKKCQCLPDYLAKNGLCFKKLNATCTNHTECWSQYCSNQRCICGPGYELHSDQTSCRRKLLKVYENWNDANRNNAFCSDNSSCIDVLAICFNDTQNPSAKFCKCPPGYQVKDENERCEAVISSLLSPLYSSVSNYGECGLCEDVHAVCVVAGVQKTCWCRSGYVKTDNKCERYMKSLILFPNSLDLHIHDFADDCANKPHGNHETDNGLCVCAPGYEFVAKDQTCGRIQRQWIDDIQEYGVCTRIDSRDEATSENDLCPKPLTCQAREDKHVCSCGKNKFVDLDDPTKCVFYVGEIANFTADECPKSALRNNVTGICECPSGYKVINRKRQCELKLSSETFPMSSSLNRTYDAMCTSLFGKRVFLSTVGECRCSEYQSFPNSAGTGCYAPLSQSLVEPREHCPNDSEYITDRCICNHGYRPSSDLHHCVRLQVQLVQYTGPSVTTDISLNTEDCQALFTGPVEFYENGRCQCKDGSFINDQGTGCWYRLDVTLIQGPDSAYCPPDSSIEAEPMCKCNVGFVRDDNKCVPITTQVYPYDYTTATNIVGITNSSCVKWFGTGAMKSINGDYCVCKVYAYPVKSNTYCHFLINAMTVEIKADSSCPANTNRTDSPLAPWACLCKPGYHVSVDGRTCETASIALVGTMNVAASHPTNCVNFTDQDCTVKYGEAAFCHDQKCFCDRRLSFINAGRKCEPFSNYIFPGEHERNLYSCTTDKDCGDKTNVICGYFNDHSRYKVCICNEGSLLDPQSQTCVNNRCGDNCLASSNFECRGYQCECKEGYYLSGDACIENTNKLQLNRPCNRSTLWTFSYTATANGTLYCDTLCDRVRCSPGYRTDQSQCVRYQLNRDKCVYREDICKQINGNSICSRDENKCSCRPSYYEFNDNCVRAVGTECSNDQECGPDMACTGKRCACTGEQQLEQISDIYGRPMQRCVNGMGRLRFSSILLLLVLTGLFFK